MLTLSLSLPLKDSMSVEGINHFVVELMNPFAIRTLDGKQPSSMTSIKKRRASFASTSDLSP